MTALIVRGNHARDSIAVGGKAAALGALSRAGFAVPPFFAITPDALTETGLKANARRLLAKYFEELGPGPFAVRSSAREEDGSVHSYAGQYLSLLAISAGGIESAALRVWHSGSSDTLFAYRASHGLDAPGSAPAIIVQRMVRARTAGVMFSADPVSGRRDRMFVSAVAGLADRLVNGEINGDDYVLDHESGAVLDGPRTGILTRTDLAALVALARKVEETQGAPQDIEWAFEGGRLFLLQARPITTKLRTAPIEDPTPCIFDNSNIVESYPGVVSPLTYSFAQYAYARVYRIFLALLGVNRNAIRAHSAMFENMLGRIDGRVYYNLINWYRMLALLPGFSISRAHMETMMGVGEALPASIAAAIGPKPARGFALVREYLRIGRVALGLAREGLCLRRSIRGFYRRLDSALGPDAAQIDSLPLSTLAAEYRRIESELLDRWDAPLINDFLCMMAFGSSRKLIERWGGQAGLDLHNAVMIGQGDIVSAEPAQRIVRMGAIAACDADLVAALANGDRLALARNPELAREIESYIAKFSDRCTEELKLESITLREDPRPLLEAVAATARSARAAPPRAAGQNDALAALFPGKPLKRLIVRCALGWAKARVRDRENLRFQRTRIFGRARRLFLAMGRQLYACGAIDEPRDVFMLTVPEVLGAIEGFATSADLRGLAAVRSAEMVLARQHPDPPERIAFTGAVLCRRFEQTAKHSSDDGGDSVRHGTGCSAGTVRARARVIRDPRNETLQAGEILVAHHTDPGWITLFANASAIVVERGSLLSHSAIVAREIGIPCVVGLKGAVDWLATGSLVEVDGALGTVRKADG